jgi:hypothetical protein
LRTFRDNRVNFLSSFENSFRKLGKVPGLEFLYWFLGPREGYCAFNRKPPPNEGGTLDILIILFR